MKSVANFLWLRKIFWLDPFRLLAVSRFFDLGENYEENMENMISRDLSLFLRLKFHF